MKLLTAFVLICGLSSAQSLYDVTAGSDLTFTGVGSTVQNYTVDFRFTANTGLVYVWAGPDIACYMSGTNLNCYVPSEANPIILPITNGTEYRARYIHDYSLRTNYLYLWTTSCSHVVQGNYTVPTSHALTVAGTWTVMNGQKFGFFRASTGLGAATECPVDRPSTPGDIFDFPFETPAGAVESTITSLTHSYMMSGMFTETTSTTASPIAVISGSAPKLVAAKSTTYNLSLKNSRSFKWPGDGTPYSYALTRSSGPGSCTITGGTTASPSINCDTSTYAASDNVLSLLVTDVMGGATATTTASLGVVNVDGNDNVVISNSNYNQAIADGKPLPRYGSSNVPFPWFTTTEAYDADLLAYALAAPPYAAAGPMGSTVSVTLSTGAVVGTSTDFSAGDVGTYVVINWDADHDGSYKGRFVAPVASVTNSTHMTLSIYGYNLEQQSDFPAGLTWGRMGVGAVTCGTLTASYSGGGQITGISNASSCSGLSWWISVAPSVTLTGGGGSGCTITANVLGPQTTSDPTQYGKLDTSTGTSAWTGIGAGCGSGYTSAPTVTITPPNEFDPPYNAGGANNWIYNYYEAGYAAGRLALRTGLASYQTEWHNFCTNVWRYSFDSGWNVSALARAAAWDMLESCAIDPSWTPPGGANTMMAGIARTVLNGNFNSYVNPSSFLGIGQYDVRSAAYITHATADLCKLGGSYGLSQMTWCTYLQHQETNIWTQELVNPIDKMGSTDTTALYAPIDLFASDSGFKYPAAGNPPGSDKFGQGPWREGGLLVNALASAYDAFLTYGDSTNAAIALNQIGKIAEFIWSYGFSPDGGTFYDVGNASNIFDPGITVNNLITNPSYTPQSGYISVNGSGANPAGYIVTGNYTPGTSSYTTLPNPNFDKRFWTGAQMQIDGVNYTVATVDSSTQLHLTYAYVGSNHNTPNFGNTCAIVVTNGSPNVTVGGGTTCKFSVQFPATHSYVGIVSGGCSTGSSCAATDIRAYGIHVDTDTTARLWDHLLGTTVNFVGTSASGPYANGYTSFIFAGENPTTCGVSKSTYCQYGGGRDLSQDVCYGFSWMYAQTSLTLWQNRAKFCYNKQNGGQSLGGNWGGAGNGYSLYARPGTIKVSQGTTTAVTGVGTCFAGCGGAAQFSNGDTIVIGDSWIDGNGMLQTTVGGTWNNPDSYKNATFLKYTVTVNSDTSMTLSSAWTGQDLSTSNGTGIFFNPTDSQWQGADGGFGILSSMTPTCNFNFPPCGGGYDFPPKTPKYGKSLGMVSGAGNGPMGMGILGITSTPSIGNIFNVSMKGISWK